ncbi:MAG: VWA domain-containing protein [Acidobacteriota bacterium]|jgi:Ca-activated chloride channel family protein|nr:VWA domain-containing protein [Acidobacteriota bacterium]
MRRKDRRSRRSTAYRISFFISAIICLLAVTTAGGAPEDEDGLPGFRVGVKVDLVSLYASVVDKDNHFAPGLDKSRFRILEDGVEQTIESFSQEDVPVSMGILLDLSGSMLGKIGQVNRAALAFIQAGNPDDEFFLIGFNDEVELLQDYTDDHDEIQDALENTVVAGKTHLYDAIYLGVEKAHKGTNPKRTAVVITDGNDDTSFYRLKELVAKIQESDVQVFCIGFLDEVPKKNIFGRWSSSEAKKYYDALVSISEETGGKAFFPRDATETHGIVAEIARDLRSQYSFGYISSNSTRDGAFRKVKIELAGKKSDLQIRHRRGYFAPGP